MKVKTNDNSDVIESEKKVNSMVSRIKDLNEKINKKKIELQGLYSAWKDAGVKNALLEIPIEEVETKKKKYFALKEEIENLALEFDPLNSALELLKERHEVVLNNADQKKREASIQRLKDIREKEGDSINRALDLLSEICSLEINTYEGKSQDQILKNQMFRYKFPLAINTLKFLTSDFSYAEYRAKGAEVI